MGLFRNRNTRNTCRRYLTVLLGAILFLELMEYHSVHSAAIAE